VSDQSLNMRGRITIGFHCPSDRDAQCGHFRDISAIVAIYDAFVKSFCIIVSRAENRIEAPVTRGFSPDRHGRDAHGTV
jgi:hypothetical protein